jgi:hypothetical protein
MAKIVDGAKETLESSQMWDDGGFGMEFVQMLDIVLSKRSTFEFTNSSELMTARFEADSESVMVNLTVGDRTTDIIAARDLTPTLTIGAIKKEIAAFMEDGPTPMTTEIAGLEEMV